MGLRNFNRCNDVVVQQRLTCFSDVLLLFSPSLPSPPPNPPRHYFNGGLPLPAATEQRLCSVFVDDALSPAQLESMCAEYDGVDELIEELAARMAPPPPALTGFGSQCSVALGAAVGAAQ